MQAKLAYLRSAFSALGKGLRVLDRRRSPPRTTPALTKDQFRRLALSDRIAYLSRVSGELREEAKSAKKRRTRIST